MPRYWVIAPVERKPPGLFDKVWKFDLENNLISIGWSCPGDVSQMSREAVDEAIAVA
jgi:restriction system protein